jgi:hypothetical protein
VIRKTTRYLEVRLRPVQIIVSSADDLLVINPWRGVQILRPTEYLVLADNGGCYPIGAMPFLRTASRCQRRIET